MKEGIQKTSIQPNLPAVSEETQTFTSHRKRLQKSNATFHLAFE